METGQRRQRTGIRGWSMLFVVLIFTGMAMGGATRRFTFDNNTGQAANDLHIEFKQAVEPVPGTTGDYGPFPNVEGSGTSKLDFDGGTVADGGSAAISFKTTSSKITVKRWWWTKDGRRISRIHTRVGGRNLPLNVQFHQLDWLADPSTALYPNSVVGEMALEFDGSEAEFLADNGGAYVNLVIDSATPGPGAQPLWAVQNLYLAFPDPDYMQNSSPTVKFRLPGQNGDDVSNLLVGLLVSDEPAAQFPLVQVDEVPVWDRPYLTGGYSGGGSAQSNLPAIIGPFIGAVLGNLPVGWAWTWEGGDEIPAVDEDDAGCAPASVARSIAYLGSAHGFAVGDVQDIYNGLYSDMNTDEDGTFVSDIISGKETYAGDNGLPIDTEQVEGVDTLDDIMKAINEGADVEILISWDPNGGHAAMVTAVTKFADGSYEITLVDDPTQGDGEAENEEYTIKVKPDGTFDGGSVDGFIVERIRRPLLLDIVRGFDFWQTPCGTSLVLPGIGEVEFEGLPGGPGGTDTVVERLSGLGAGETGEIPIEMRWLSLVGCEPITVNFGDGPGLWDVHVGLDPGLKSQGVLTVRTHDDAERSGGGTFDCSINANLMARLHPHGPGQEQIIHFAHTFNCQGANWSHEPPPDYPNPQDAGHFFPRSIETPNLRWVPARVHGAVSDDGSLPPLCDQGNFGDGYHLVNTVRWEDTVQQRTFELMPGSVHCPTAVTSRIWDMDPLTERPVEAANFNSVLNGHIRVTDNRTGRVLAEGAPLDLTGDVQTLVFDKDPNQVFGRWETELAWMQLSGTINLPPQNPFVAVSVGREHPAGRSLGHTSVLTVSNIGSSGEDGVMVESEFHVNTWLWIWDWLAQEWGDPIPSEGPPAHMVLGGPPHLGEGGMNPGEVGGGIGGGIGGIGGFGLQ